MNAFATPQNILITGASSGVGAALALAYAKPGCQLFLGGRDNDRLAAISEQVEQSGATCQTRTIDVTNGQVMTDWIADTEQRAPLDLVIANAGISAGARKRADAPHHSDAAIFATNVDGVINTVTPALEHMRARGRGQIALMSSLASFRAFRDSPAYCASKAAVRFYGAGLRHAPTNKGIGISVICPGFVRSPMTDANDFKMPLLMDTDRAARLIQTKLARNRAMIAFPLPMYLAVRVLALF